MKYYIVDAFTDRPFGGNTAGVVLLGDEPFPDERLMLQVAAELRYSETAFVRFTHAITHSHNNTFEAHVRYFTPKAEVELCGHATVATFALLHRLGQAEGRCLCHTLAGDLMIDAGERVMMQMATPRIVETITDTEPIYRALGIADYRPALPMQIAYAGLKDSMIPVPDVATLNALHPDMEAIAAITKVHDACSFHVFALSSQTIKHSGNQAITAFVRDFAPLYDIPEESATGTANAALTHYLATNGVIPSQGDFAFLQGETMGRPSVVATRIAPDGTVYVGGTAAIVAGGELFAASIPNTGNTAATLPGSPPCGEKKQGSKRVMTMESQFNIRPARPDEAGLVLEFIKKLASYEKCADEVVADEATLHHSLFVERSAEVLFAEEDGVAIGFALFFHNFSTFVGRKGLYLEDLFILPEKRGRGYGKALLKYLANLAVERHCGRMEWICLDWNKPALQVYRSIGAIPMDEWTVQRLDESSLEQFANC